MLTLLKAGGKTAWNWGKSTFGKSATKTTMAAGAGGVALGSVGGYGVGLEQGTELKKIFGGWFNWLIFGATAFVIYKIWSAK